MLTFTLPSTRERPPGPCRATGQRPPADRQEEGRTFANPLGLPCGLLGALAPAPAGGVPVRRKAPDREGRPALPNPPRPPRGWTARRCSSRPSWRPRRVARPRRKGARRWAVPCHDHGRGRRESVGAPAASSLVLCPAPAGPAGRLDPASRAGAHPSRRARPQGTPTPGARAAPGTAAERVQTQYALPPAMRVTGGGLVDRSTAERRTDPDFRSGRACRPRPTPPVVFQLGG